MFSLNPCSDRLAEDYASLLVSGLKRQSCAEVAVERLLRMKAATVLGLEPCLKRFGSRVYGGQSPRSDLDVVCVLPEDDTSCHEARIHKFLKAMLDILQQDAGCTRVHDAIEGKWTVQFSFANMPVDFSAYCGPVEGGHSQSQLTARVARRISTFPVLANTLIRLVTDFAKRTHVCWNKKGPLGTQMKSIHWVLLVIAWWSWRFPDGRGSTADLSLGAMFVEVLEFYSQFRFEKWIINAFSLRRPFSPHECATGDTNDVAIWVAVLGYKRWPPGNMLHKTGSDKIVAIQNVLTDELATLDADRESFWSEARYQLHSYVDLDYSPPVSQMPEDESFDGWI
jgi:predicted nucleotidyltransferase